MPAAWICDDRAGGNSHNALTDSQFRIFTSARSYDKTYNLASPKSKSYHRIRLIFCRLHSNIIILAPARSSKNSTSLYRAAGGGTQDANYAVPERTSPGRLTPATTAGGVGAATPCKSLIVRCLYSTPVPTACFWVGSARHISITH